MADPRDDDPADEASSGAASAATEAQEILRAIAAGEVDAFVVADSGPDGQVVTLSTADRPYRMFVENMRDGAATLSASGHIVYANRRLAEMLSFPIETIVGSPLTMLVTAGASGALELLAAPGRHGTSIELELVDGRGETVPVLVGASPLHVDGHHLTCLTFADLSAQRSQDAVIARMSEAQAEQVADLQRARDALTRQASHDALTGLPNRDLLVDRVEQALYRSREHGGCVATLFVDLDRFKQVNDTKGHAAGDAVLRSVAQRLIGAIRPLDTVARLGGDEFVVLAEDVDGVRQAVEIATRLTRELGRVPGPEEQVERVTGSVGVSVSHGGAGSAESLLHEADTAMYHAKALGGDRVEVFDVALGDQLDRRTHVRQALDDALAEDRVVAYFEPIIDVGSRRLAGFEARARIDVEEGVLLPSEFNTMAEETGLIASLGTRMLVLGCQEAAAWSGAGLVGAPCVAINVSARQFEAGDLPVIVGDVLDATGLAPSLLRLELLERAVLGLDPEVVGQLRRIRDLGVEIGLDEFGTDVASVTHLNRLPLTFLKVDKSFVSRLGAAGDVRIVAAMLDLAANLQLRSVAEGVETQSELDCLHELGCDEAQGELFAPARPGRSLGPALSRSSW